MQRSFTALAEKITARVLSGTLKISVSLQDPIFADVVLRPGDVVAGSQAITVLNNGNLDLRYWIFADWIGVPPTTKSEALLAAQKLTVTITKAGIPPVPVFTGKLLQLYNQPPGGRFLSPLQKEMLHFTLSLPVHSNDFSLDARLKVAFLFVAESG